MARGNVYQGPISGSQHMSYDAAVQVPPGLSRNSHTAEPRASHLAKMDVVRRRHAAHLSCLLEASRCDFNRAEPDVSDTHCDGGRPRNVDGKEYPVRKDSLTISPCPGQASNPSQCASFGAASRELSCLSCRNSTLSFMACQLPRPLRRRLMARQQTAWLEITGIIRQCQTSRRPPSP